MGKTGSKLQPEKNIFKAAFRTQHHLISYKVYLLVKRELTKSSAEMKLTQTSCIYQSNDLLGLRRELFEV